MPEKGGKRPEIALVETKSSAIPGIGYHPESQTLRIRFASGHEYEAKATPEEHQALAGAKSIGSHYHQHLRGKKWERVA